MAEETKTVVLEINLDIANSAKSLTELKTLQKSLNAELGNAKIGTEEYKKLEVETGLVSKRIQGLQSDTKQLNKETGVQVGSLRDLQAQYGKLSQALRETAPGNKVLGLSFEDAQKKAKALKGEIGNFEEKLGNFQGNVGNYGGALKEASLNTGIFASQTQALSGGFAKVSSGLQVAKLGFTTLKGAILATGIGALLIAFATLISYFTATDEGADALARNLAGIKAVFDDLVGRAALLGKAFVQLFSGDFEGASASASAAFDDLAGSLAKSFTEASRLTQALDDLEDAQLKQSVINAQRKREVDTLIAQSKDRTKTEKERLAILDKATKIETEGIVANLDLLKQRAKIAKENLDIAISTGAISKGNINQDFADAEIAYQQALGESDQKLADIQARRSKFLLADQAERDAAVKREQDRVAKLRELSEKELQERVDRGKRIDQAEQDLENGRLQNKIKNIDIELSLDEITNEKKIQLLTDKKNLELEIELNKTTVLLENTQLEADQRTLINENYVQKKIELEAKLAADTDKINQETIAKDKADAAKKKQIDDLSLQNKINGTKAALGSIASLFEENTTAYKALASAQALIDTFQSATAAYKSVVGTPYIGPALGAAAAAASIAAGYKTIEKINSVQFEQGGIAGSGGGSSKQGVIGGNLHSNGGTKFYGTDGSIFEAERGELLTVVNRWDTSKLKSLSSLNSGHGVPFYETGGIIGKTYLRDGGFAARQASGSVSSDAQNLNDIIQIVQSLPAPVVGVADILDKAQQRTQVRVQATLTK